MSALFVLIPVSVALAAGFVAACLAAIRSGQFDDVDSPRWRILFDDSVTGREVPRPAGRKSDSGKNWERKKIPTQFHFFWMQITMGKNRRNRLISSGF